MGHCSFGLTDLLKQTQILHPAIPSLYVTNPPEELG